jgi:hypothetical protein
MRSDNEAAEKSADERRCNEQRAFISIEHLFTPGSI